MMSLWSRADHPSESEGCNSGTSDPGSDDFFVRYSWGIQRIFSGIQKYDANIYLPDH